MISLGNGILAAVISSISKVLLIVIPIAMGLWAFFVFRGFYKRQLNRTGFKEVHVNNKLAGKLDTLNKGWSSKLNDYNKEAEKDDLLNRIMKKEASKFTQFKNAVIRLIFTEVKHDKGFLIFSLFLLFLALFFTALKTVPYGGLIEMMYLYAAEIIIWIQLLAVKYGFKLTSEEDLAEQFMHLNSGIYLSATSFDVSIKRMIKVLPTNSNLRTPLKNFLENIEIMGRSMSDSLDLMKKDFNYVPELVTYLDNVKTIEQTSNELKQSLIGLTTGLRNKINLNKIFYKASFVNIITYIVTLLPLLFYNKLASKFSGTFEMSIGDFIVQNILLFIFVILGFNIAVRILSKTIDIKGGKKHV